MKTLIIPCGGKSSRFPGVKPKWMLTHPDGDLMIQKVIEACPLSDYDKLVITIIKKHDQQYDAKLLLTQAINVLKSKMFVPEFEICVLEDFTKSASETVYLTVKKLAISGQITVKDSDCLVAYNSHAVMGNFIVSVSLSDFSKISNILGKSFLKINSQGIIQDIVEKNVVSDYICVGVYSFDDSSTFCNAYEYLTKMGFQGELYLSYVVSYLISRGVLFFANPAINYIDWGTIDEWKLEQKKYRTYFIDFDGVLIKNSGRYGTFNWDTNADLLLNNCQRVRELQQKGAQIVITTARPEQYRSKVLQLLSSVDIYPYALIMGLNHAQRIIVNDFASTNPYPSCLAVSLPRNGDLKNYL